MGESVGSVGSPGGQVGQAVRARGDHPDRPGPVGFGLVLDMWQPFQPGPVGILGVLGEDADLQQVGRMEDRQVADHRGQQSIGSRSITADRDRWKTAQLHEFRAIVDQPMGTQELDHPHVAYRLEIGLGAALLAASSPPTAGFNSRSTAGWSPIPMRATA